LNIFFRAELVDVRGI